MERIIFFRVRAEDFAKAVFVEWVAEEKPGFMHAYDIGYVQNTVSKSFV